MDQELPTYRPRYLDSPHWLSKPEFWALHVYSYCRLGYGSRMNDDAIFGAFGLQAAAVWKFYAHEFAHSGPEAIDYPCYRLTLPLPNGAMVALEYHQFPEDNHMQYRLYRPSASGELQGVYTPNQTYRPDDPSEFGDYDGQSWNPKITWDELLLISDSVGQAAGNSLCNAAAVPLIFPAVLLADSDNASLVLIRLREAWTALNILPVNHAEIIAIEMMAENHGLAKFIGRHHARQHAQPRRFDFLRDVANNR
jgi:hypothetical protein